MSHTPVNRSHMLGLVAAVLLGAGRANGDVFNYLGSPVDVTPATTGSYVDVDVSASVPAGATGVILQMLNTSGAVTYHYGVRNNGSSDTWMTSSQRTALGGCTGFYMIGVDGSRIFECFTENAAVKTYLVGYTTAGATFFTNAVNKSTATTGSYQTVNISGDSGAATAIGAIFIMKNTIGSASQFQVRKTGSSDDRYTSIMAGHASAVLIGVDASETCEQKIQVDTLDLYLVGYITTGAVLFTNAVSVAQDTINTYQPTDITSSIGTNDDATGAVIEVTTSSGRTTAIRGNGASHDYYGYLEHAYGLCAIDSGDVFQQKIGHASVDLYLVGYTVHAATRYRSVGTNTGTIYSTGNCTINSGSTTATFGAGASLPSNVGQGDKLTIGGTEFYILSRDSATQCTVQDAATSTLTNQAYTIKRAYNDFASWETARQGDLVASDRNEVAVAYDDGDFTTGVTIDGSTTDATHFMRIVVATGHGHAGVAGAGAVIDMNSVATAITVSDDYTRVEGLQITRTGGGNTRSGVYVVSATNCRVTGLIIYNFDTPHTCRGVRVGASGGVEVWNTLVYDGVTAFLADATATTLTVLNCTAQGMTGYGIACNGGTVTATNTIAVDCTLGDFSGTITQSYNMSSDASASGTGSLASRNSGSQFVNVTAGSEDLHLKLGAEAVNGGTSLAGTFTSDLDGQTRPAVWDMGADERFAPSTEAYYRSVGTNSGTIYSTGNASISSGSATVTFGDGASLPSNVGAGDRLTIGSTVFHMYSRDSATQATVQETASSTLTNQSYTIKRAYNDFATWESARNGDLVSEDRREVAVAYADGEFVPGASITIDGSTTDATRYMMITVAEGQRHAGVHGSGVALDSNNTGTYDGLRLLDDYTRVEWLRFRRYGGTDDRAAVYCAASNVAIDKLIIHDYLTGGGSVGIRPVSGSVTIRNCLIYNGASVGIRAATGATATVTIQNCTVVGMSVRGIRRQAGTVTVSNTIAMGNGTADFAGTLTQSYNMSSDTTANCVDCLPSKVTANQFVSTTTGSENLHLKAGADAFNAGSDLSVSFTDDVDTDTRPAGAAWDIGADERLTISTNYRSVGTNTGNIYATGVVSINSGSTTATFVGASLPANVGAGDKLTIGATDFHLVSRDTATQATVQEVAVSTLDSQAYVIKRAYNDFATWETARQGNLVGELRLEAAVAYDDGDFTDAVTIDGSTTDATRYMMITAPSGQRHAGMSGVGAVLDMDNLGTGITVSDDYTRIQWLQVRRTGGVDARSAVYVTAASNVLIEDLVIYDFQEATNVYGIRGGANAGATIRNCMLYDGTGQGITTDSASAALTVQNCSLYGITGRGLYKSLGAITVTNTIAMGCSIEDFGSGLTQSYNMSSDGSAAGTGSLPGETAGDQYVSVLSGNQDLHLKTGSAAINAGSDLSGSFAIDIDNGARAAPWDMGADDYSAYGTGQKQTPRVATWREAAP